MILKSGWQDRQRRDTPMALPKDAAERKKVPLYRGLFRYFPDALVEVARSSLAGQSQHNPDKEEIFWDRSKSGDELDALMRHLLEVGTFDKDGIRHSAKVAWRALANLQKEIEADRELATLQDTWDPAPTPKLDYRDAFQEILKQQSTQPLPPCMPQWRHLGDERPQCAKCGAYKGDPCGSLLAGHQPPACCLPECLPDCDIKCRAKFAR